MDEMSSAGQALVVTFVVPCYNEEATAPEFHRRAMAVGALLPGCEVRLLFVDDGSHDGTATILDGFAEDDERVGVLHLARNMGHQAAVTAGLDFVDTDVAVIIDADLQDPPELAVEFVARVRQGFDVVHARRRSRTGETWFKLATASLFYRLMSRFATRELVADSGDFRAVTRPVIEAARAFREPHRFLRAMFATIGFRQAVVTYDRAARFAGATHYSWRRMVHLAVNAVFNYSSAPLRAIAWAAVASWGISLLYLAKAIYEALVLQITVRGWTSLVLLFSLYSGLQLLSMAVVGSYLSRVFEQGQQRPLYWVGDARNVEMERGAAADGEREISARIARGRRLLAERLARLPALGDVR